MEELALLAEEGELSVEELRQKYLGVAPESSTSSHSSLNQNDSNTLQLSNMVSGTGATSSMTYFTDDILNDENDDEEYLPPPDPYKKFVRVGSDYQVIFFLFIRVYYNLSFIQFTEF